MILHFHQSINSATSSDLTDKHCTQGIHSVQGYNSRLSPCNHDISNRKFDDNRYCKLDQRSLLQFPSPLILHIAIATLLLHIDDTERCIIFTGKVEGCFWS
jgi:hypothetical protein